MREQRVEENLVKRIKAKGGLCLKFTSPGFTGVPDRVVIMPKGKLTFVELKRPDRRAAKNAGLSQRQVRVADQLRALGFQVETLYTPEEVKEFVDEL